MNKNLEIKSDLKKELKSRSKYAGAGLPHPALGTEPRKESGARVRTLAHRAQATPGRGEKCCVVQVEGRRFGCLGAAGQAKQP